MKRKIWVKLSDVEIDRLEGIVGDDQYSERIKRRARVLLMSNAGRSQKAVSEELKLSRLAIMRIQERYAASGLQGAIFDKFRPGGSRKLTAEQEAELIRVWEKASEEGKSNLSLAMLPQKAKELGLPDISHSTAKRTIHRARNLDDKIQNKENIELRLESPGVENKKPKSKARIR